MLSELIFNFKMAKTIIWLNLWVRIPLRWGVLDTTLCDKVCQWLATGRWFSLGTTVSFTNKTDYHDITEIVLIVALNTITLTLNKTFCIICKNYLHFISYFRISSKTVDIKVWLDITKWWQCFHYESGRKYQNKKYYRENHIWK